jgi:hypothetical protein
VIVVPPPWSLSVCGALALYFGFPAKKLGVEGMTGCWGRVLYRCVMRGCLAPKFQLLDFGLG